MWQFCRHDLMSMDKNPVISPNVPGHTMLSWACRSSDDVLTPRIGGETTVARPAFRALLCVVTLLLASVGGGDGLVRVTRADIGRSLTCGPLTLILRANVGADELVGVAGASPTNIMAVGSISPTLSTTATEPLVEHYDGTTSAVSCPIPH